MLTKMLAAFLPPSLTALRHFAIASAFSPANPAASFGFSPSPLVSAKNKTTAWYDIDALRSDYRKKMSSYDSPQHYPAQL